MVYQFMPIIMFKILNFGMKAIRLYCLNRNQVYKLKLLILIFHSSILNCFLWLWLPKYLMKQKKYADQFLANKQIEKKSCFKKMEIFNSFRDDEVIRSCCFSNGNHYTNRYFRKLDRKSNEINSPVINV